MSKLRDLTGQVFGRLTVTNQWRRNRKRTQWLCQCSCGSPKKWIDSPHLLKGESTSCGCAQREMAAKARLKHGHRKKASRTYRAWVGMWTRTTNPKCKSAKYYFERGILIEESRWQDFAEFLKEKGECPPGKSLDRINNNRGYSPQNCRWATPLEQNRNTSRTKLTFDAAVLITLRRLRGEPAKSIAVAYNIHPIMVWYIVTGKRWKGAHITGAFLLDLEEE